MRRKSNSHNGADVPIANRIEYVLFKTTQGLDHLAEQEAILDVLVGDFIEFQNSIKWPFLAFWNRKLNSQL